MKVVQIVDQRRFSLIVRLNQKRQLKSSKVAKKEERLLTRS